MFSKYWWEGWHCFTLLQISLMSGFTEVIWVLVSFSSLSLLWFAVFIEVYEENFVSHRDGFDTTWPGRPSEGLLGTHWSTKRSLMHTLRTSSRDYSHHCRRFPQEPLSWPSRLGLPRVSYTWNHNVSTFVHSTVHQIYQILLIHSHIGAHLNCF